MKVMVGQSSYLKYVMDEQLSEEISRGLWIFFCSLLGGSLLLFVIFSAIFERRLQIRVTKPISQLSKQIRDPKSFVSERNSALDFYARKSSQNGTDLSTTRMTSEGTILTPRSSSSTSSYNRKSRGSSMGRSKTRDIVGSQWHSEQ